MLFATACVLSPLLAAGLIEILLRPFGFGGYPSLFRAVDEIPQGTLTITEPTATRGFFFANPKRPGYTSQYDFTMPKPTHTVRIVLAGGSAIQGFPQNRRFAAGSFLREMLSDCWPERDVEIINLGTTAVASFPVRELVKQGLACDPDLVVLYTGHNEFYGAYGVASLNRGGSTPRMLEFQYRMRSLALVQGLTRAGSHLQRPRANTLMEAMVGQDHLSPQDPKRKAAATLLYHNVASMIKMCGDRDIPVLVCSLPSNERDLAPVGCKPAKEENQTLATLARQVEQRPEDARAHFLLGKACFAAGDPISARRHFTLARDLDPMPWRATTQSQQGLRRAVDERGGAWCDVQEAFRKNSPGESIGWELMDDHVHLSLRGQALLARTLVEALALRTDKLRVPPDRLATLPDDKSYAERLGDNPYDRYGAAHTLRVLLSIPFLLESNPEARERFDRIAKEYEGGMSPEILAIARKWQTRTPHAGGKRPLTGMVARGLLRENQVTEAMDLFAVAQHSVPTYTSWHLEYVYFWLACRHRLQGELSPPERKLALDEIERGRILLRHGYAESGLSEHYLARMHQLRGEFAESIPLLERARTKLYGFERVATEQALILSYVNTHQLESARAIARTGAAESGSYAEIYRNLLQAIPSTP